MSFLSVLAPILGGVGSLIGSNEQNQQYKQLEQMINQIMSQAQGVQGQTENAISGLEGEAGAYTSQLPGLAQIMSRLNSGAAAQAPGAASSYLNNAMSPQALAALTGINAGGLTSNATNYLSKPGSTNLSQVSPGVLSTYANMMVNGLNPQVQNNAQSQLQQQFQTSQANIDASALPGQNTAALNQEAQNNLLTQSTNLAGNLAGQNQAVRSQGASGLTSAASGLDAQTMQYLMQAAGLGTQYNQTVLGNQAAGAGFGQNLIDQLMNFTNTGNQLNEFGIGALGSLGSQITQEGEMFADLGSNAGANAAQTNPFSILGNMLSGMNFGGGGGSSFSGPLPVFFGGNTGINLPTGNATTGADLSAWTPQYVGAPTAQLQGI